MYIYLLLLLLSLSLSLPLGEDDDELISNDHPPAHNYVSLVLSLSVLSLIESSFVRANRTTKRNETLMHTLSLLLYTIG
jgi:hypothetical protein